jgi:putative hydrolase of the HAD superfamily
MTPSLTDARGLQALLLDYNGVVGTQPTEEEWENLAALAGWPVGQHHAFQQAFWRRREAYDAGAITTHAFWHGLLRGGRSAPQGSQLLTALRRTDTAMWTNTDPNVLAVLHAAHATGLPIILVSNAPHPVADALEDTAWCRTLVTRTVFSARLGANKPHRRMYEAGLAAAGWPRPDKTIFIDDRADNCLAASGLGMRTLHYTGDPSALARHLPQATPAAIR